MITDIIRRVNDAGTLIALILAGMRISELLIIYLACGAPFAVHRATSTGRVDWPLFAVALLAWPFFAVRLIGKHFLHGQDNNRDLQVEHIRRQIEAIAFPANEMRFVFEFREIFYRFVGLSQALSSPVGGHAQLFEITGHANASTAARCLARRERARLERHAAAARSDLISAVGELPVDDQPALTALIAELSASVGNPIAADELVSAGTVLVEALHAPADGDVRKRTFEAAR